MRLWEDEYGLLAPERSPGGTRLYSEADIKRIREIRRLVREQGFALGAVARIIDEAHNSDAAHTDRMAIEDLYLREATDREHIQEGRRMAGLHAVMRRVVRSSSGQQAALTLVDGIKNMTGTDTAALGLYERSNNTLKFVVTARGERVEALGRPPLQVARFPRAWQQAIDAREPYADSDLFRVDLPPSMSSRVVEDRTRSFHAEPLAIADELVGVLIVGSFRPRGIQPEAERVSERLAVAAGPAIHYFAAQF